MLDYAGCILKVEEPCGLDIGYERKSQTTFKIFTEKLDECRLIKRSIWNTDIKKTLSRNLFREIWDIEIPRANKNAHGVKIMGSDV